ncbi:MAG: DsrE family protein [Bacteroidales bacterium]|nr:DsrE family protein [Bacteroidales bacterium]MDT8374251.1 DsrE family protein [Bacteroidales bacterium]
MMKQRNMIILFAGILLCLAPMIQSQTVNTEPTPDKLVVVWTSDDPMVAERVALMYTHAAKTAGWFKDVTLVIWGPSAKLITENIKLQDKLRAMQKDGVVIEACVACANAYGVTEDLKKLGYDVKGMGKPLTDYLKSGAKVLTF